MNVKEIIQYRSIRQNTLKQYIRGGEKLAEKLGVKKLTIQLIKRRFADINSILDTSTLHQKKAIITLLLLVVAPDKENPKDKLLHKELVNLLFIEDRKYQDERSNNVFNKKEKLNWLEWDEVMNIREKLVEKYLYTKSFSDLENVIIISLYTIQRPRRLEYADCIIIDEMDYMNTTLLNKTNNIYLVVGYTMYFSLGSNATKTEINNNFQIISVKEPLYDLLIEYIRLNKSIYLIRKKDGNKMTHPGLGSRLNKLFAPKKISASMLRKIYISNIPDNISWKQREIIAKEMGHSVTTAMKIYNKISSSESEEADEDEVGL
tara:strand:- start:255 stop:1211 length:957 start_codon:yes stop_codon:yes gene_type:complete